MRTPILLALLGACGGKQPTTPSPSNADTAGGSAQTASAASGGPKVPEGKTLLCSDPKDETRSFELWDSGDFEFHYGQVGITGSYVRSGDKLTFTPDPSKDWAQYSGFDTKEFSVTGEWAQIGAFPCRWLGA